MTDSVAPASSAQTLTPREIMTLTAVAGLMGDVPQIDYEELAPLIGQKYAKNARANVKKLFEKLRGGNAGSAKGEKPSTPANSDGEDGDPKKKKTPAKKATPKKAVGPRATPKKAAGEKKIATPRKSKAKVEDDAKDEVQNEVTPEDSDTKAELMDEDED